MATFNFELHMRRNNRGTVTSILNNQGNLRKKSQPKTKQKKNYTHTHTKTQTNLKKPPHTKASNTEENFAFLNVLTSLQPHCAYVRHHISLQVQNCSRRRIQVGKGRGKEKQVPVFSFLCKHTNPHSIA